MAHRLMVVGIRRGRQPWRWRVRLWWWLQQPEWVRARCLRAFANRRR